MQKAHGYGWRFWKSAKPREAGRRLMIEFAVCAGDRSGMPACTVTRTKGQEQEQRLRWCAPLTPRVDAQGEVEMRWLAVMTGAPLELDQIAMRRPMDFDRMREQIAAIHKQRAGLATIVKQSLRW